MLTEKITMKKIFLILFCLPLLFSTCKKEEEVLNNKFLSFLCKMTTSANTDQKETLKEKKIELVQIIEYYLDNIY